MFLGNSCYQLATAANSKKGDNAKSIEHVTKSEIMQDNDSVAKCVQHTHTTTEYDVAKKK